MKYYQDITLLPDAEVSLGFIWEKLYQQIHLMLVEHKIAENSSQVGCSFPDYGDKTFPLGRRLRLLAQTDEQLKNMHASHWLQRLSDYIHIKSIKPVPKDVSGYACFYRLNTKSQQRRLKQLERRVPYLSQKHGVDESEVREKLLSSIYKNSAASKLPYINVQSLSTPFDGPHYHKFMLFIQCDKSNTALKNSHTFTCYGLSSAEPDKKNFIPWF